MSSVTIKEGFICADCHAQFTNPQALWSHYEREHPQEESNLIKGLFVKAKNKLTINSDNAGISTSDDSSSLLLRGPPRYFDVYTDNVSDGKIYSHYDNFKKIRTVQVEKYSSESNKILIRLQKLLSFHCDDSSRRKAQEQDIVSWIDEKVVTRCPDCAQSFNLLLRKHHCRLCGSIMCENCSIFIKRELGESIVKHQMGISININGEPTNSDLRNTISRRLSINSVDNLVTQSSPHSYRLRSCLFCYNLVIKKQAFASQSKPIIIQFYEKLRALQQECEMKNAEYIRMITSLREGEKLFSIEQVTKFRNDIIKNTEKIDILSKKILVLGTESTESESEIISETEKRLRTRIRTTTINWIRDFLSGLRLIPETAVSSSGSGPNKEKDPVLKFVEGWTASKPDASNIDESTDVMEIQITQTKKWIEEARAAKKLDEVEILEASLTELLKIHYQQSL